MKENALFKAYLVWYTLCDEVVTATLKIDFLLKTEREKYLLSKFLHTKKRFSFCIAKFFLEGKLAKWICI